MVKYALKEGSDFRIRFLLSILIALRFRRGTSKRPLRYLGLMITFSDKKMKPNWEFHK